MAFGEAGMDRFLIFILLAPPIAFTCLILAAVPWGRPVYPQWGMIALGYGASYVFGIAPALLMFGVDWWLARINGWARLVATTCAGFVAGAVASSFYFGQYPTLRD